MKQALNDSVLFVVLAVIIVALVIDIKMDITVRQSRQSGVARATCPD